MNKGLKQVTGALKKHVCLSLLKLDSNCNDLRQSIKSPEQHRIDRYTNFVRAPLKLVSAGAALVSNGAEVGTEIDSALSSAAEFFYGREKIKHKIVEKTLAGKQLDPSIREEVHAFCDYIGASFRRQLSQLTFNGINTFTTCFARCIYEQLQRESYCHEKWRHKLERALIDGADHNIKKGEKGELLVITSDSRWHFNELISKVGVVAECEESESRRKYFFRGVMKDGVVDLSYSNTSTYGFRRVDEEDLLGHLSPLYWGTVTLEECKTLQRYEGRKILQPHSEFKTKLELF